MTEHLRLGNVSRWRQHVRRHRSGSLFTVAWLTVFSAANFFVMGWLWSLPLALLFGAALVMVIREVVLMNRQAVRRIESAGRDVRPRAGVWVRRDGTERAVRFIETGESGLFMAVDIDGEPVMADQGDSITVDVIGPGQSVTWSQRK